MAKVKYVVKEYVPTGNMSGVHSFYAQARQDNTITNAEIAKKIENRGISRASEIKMILEEASKVILEEVMENNRVQLDTGEGVLVVAYRPTDEEEAEPTTEPTTPTGGNQGGNNGGGDDGMS